MGSPGGPLAGSTYAAIAEAETINHNGGLTVFQIAVFTRPHWRIFGLAG
jgi:hypothetical protein